MPPMLRYNNADQGWALLVGCFCYIQTFKVAQFMEPLLDVKKSSGLWIIWHYHSVDTIAENRDLDQKQREPRGPIGSIEGDHQDA